jgi:hypothetical protein
MQKRMLQLMAEELAYYSGAGQLSEPRGGRAPRGAAPARRCPEAIRAVMQTSHALRRPVDEIGLEDVQSWAKAIFDLGYGTERS